METLSPRQQDVLTFIRTAVTQRGIPPTYREIGDALGIASTNGVADHIKALVKKGYIKKDGFGIARGLCLTPKGRSIRRQDVQAIPIVNPAAGTPLVDMSGYDKTLHLDRTLLSTAGGQVAVRIGVGASSSGIFPGDVVVVKPGAVSPGGIAVALRNGVAIAGVVKVVLEGFALLTDEGETRLKDGELQGPASALIRKMRS